LVEEGGRRNVPQVIDVIGLIPAGYVVGGVLVELAYDYLIFDAVQYDEYDREIGTGKAVIRLDGCLDWAFRTAGDASLAASGVDPSYLAEFETYEVLNSTWVAALRDETGSDEDLHHFIITFGGTSFEWVGTYLNAQLIPMDFDTIYDWLQTL
jgi:hypothetical protein